MRSLTAALLFFVVPGCVHSSVRQLPLYAEARKGSGPERPKLFQREALDWSAMPDLLPFAQETWIYDSLSDAKHIAYSGWWSGQEETADVVVFGETSRQPNGLIFATADFLRLAPSKLGIRASDDGMVLYVDPLTVTASGLLEGDKILILGGARWEGSGQNSEQVLMRWRLKPDTEALIVWIRPGTGRMEGKVKALANPPIHLALSDFLPWKEPPPPPDSMAMRRR
jgi:hypothetical protein